MNLSWVLWSLTLLFVGLKLAGEIDWNWLLVLSPILVPAFLAGMLFVLVLFFILVIVLAVSIKGGPK